MQSPPEVPWDLPAVQTLTRQPWLQHHLLHVPSAPATARRPSWVLSSSLPYPLGHTTLQTNGCLLAISTGSCFSPGFFSSCLRRHAEQIRVSPLSSDVHPGMDPWTPSCSSPTPALGQFSWRMSQPLSAPLLTQFPVCTPPHTPSIECVCRGWGGGCVVRPIAEGHLVPLCPRWDPVDNSKSRGRTSTHSWFYYT